MQDLKVTSWQLFGYDRLYVNLPDGTAIGWADLGSGTITVLHPRYRDAVTDALARQVPDIPALGEVAPPGPPAPSAPPPVPRIPPLRRMRKRGADRDAAPPEALPVPDAPPGALPGAASVPDRAVVQAPRQRGASPEAEAGPRPGRAPRTRADAAGHAGERSGGGGQAPAVDPYLAGVPKQGRAPQRTRTAEQAPPPQRTRMPQQSPERSRAPEQAPPPPRTRAPEQEPAPVTRRDRRDGLPALIPASDLSTRRPGAALREQLDASGPGALVRAATGALRRHRDADPRRTALTGERRVGAELKRLTRHGWRVLHSVPLPDGTEIGHLLIGPGGVFAVRTEHHPQTAVRLGDGTLQIGDGAPEPYVLDDRPESRRVQAVLEAHCTFAVPVQTVLVFVGVTTLDVLATPPGVRVCRERHVSALAPLTGVLTATQVERVYDIARNREAWLDA
ncbi:NERD domain-containing protein [Streptomyces clavifer]|uniref:NERD domain-containing protein n=1 Tax=Streptomyces clavifer TaxID=68188 RepID=UPI00308C6CD1|nr:NERD domain-containing protein [Streptomyces clavifer]